MIRALNTGLNLKLQWLECQHSIDSRTRSKIIVFALLMGDRDMVVGKHDEHMVGILVVITDTVSRVMKDKLRRKIWIRHDENLLKTKTETLTVIHRAHWVLKARLGLVTVIRASDLVIQSRES